MILLEERDIDFMNSNKSLEFFQNPRLIHSTPAVASDTVVLIEQALII
jgi:hypothetical protein